MIEANIIVLTTPVYFYFMNAQLKTLIDRTIPRYANTTDRDKEAMDGTIKGLSGFLHCLPDSKEKGIVYENGTFGIGEIKNMPAMNEAYEFGKSI